MSDGSFIFYGALFGLFFSFVAGAVSAVAGFPVSPWSPVIGAAAGGLLGWYLE